MTIPATADDSKPKPRYGLTDYTSGELAGLAAAAPGTVIEPGEFKARMQGIYEVSENDTGMQDIYGPGGYDKSRTHSEADALMCALLSALGYGDGVGIFLSAEKWYE